MATEDDFYDGDEYVEEDPLEILGPDHVRVLP
jgi:hypothetical protein